MWIYVIQSNENILAGGQQEVELLDYAELPVDANLQVY